MPEAGRFRTGSLLRHLMVTAGKLAQEPATAHTMPQLPHRAGIVCRTPSDAVRCGVVLAHQIAFTSSRKSIRVGAVSKTPACCDRTGSPHRQASCRAGVPGCVRDLCAVCRCVFSSAIDARPVTAGHLFVGGKRSSNVHNVLTWRSRGYKDRFPGTILCHKGSSGRKIYLSMTDLYRYALHGGVPRANR